VFGEGLDDETVDVLVGVVDLGEALVVLELGQGL